MKDDIKIYYRMDIDDMQERLWLINGKLHEIPSDFLEKIENRVRDFMRGTNKKYRVTVKFYEQDMDNCILNKISIYILFTESNNYSIDVETHVDTGRHISRYL